MNQIAPLIKLIGMKRLAVLGALGGAIVLIALVYFGSILPSWEDATREKNSLSGEVSDLQGKINAATEEVIFTKENLPKYNGLKDKGFFLDQDRFMITRSLEELRKKTPWTDLPYSIGGIESVTLPPEIDLSAIHQKLIYSRIKVGPIPVVLDMDVYASLDELARSFPAQTRIQKIEIRRVKEVTRQNLMNIVEHKADADFMKVDVAFDWITMIPVDDATASPEAR